MRASVEFPLNKNTAGYNKKTYYIVTVRDYYESGNK
jgi:hypothetical protein